MAAPFENNSASFSDVPSIRLVSTRKGLERSCGIMGAMENVLRIETHDERGPRSESEMGLILNGFLDQMESSKRN